MDALTILNAVVAVLNIALAGFQGWREWQQHQTPPPHPLEATLRDIALAIRARQTP